MRKLGVILAGGRSRRFGSDKAEFMIEGLPLIEHVNHLLARSVDQVAIAGRNWPGLLAIADHPEPGLGPLGGLCGALMHARTAGYDGVISAPCDTFPLPIERLGDCDGAVVLADQPLIGWWPIGVAEQLASWLANKANRAVFAWIEAIGPHQVASQEEMFNLNTRADVERWRDNFRVLRDRNHGTD